MPDQSEPESEFLPDKIVWRTVTMLVTSIRIFITLTRVTVKTVINLWLMPIRIPYALVMFSVAFTRCILEKLPVVGKFIPRDESLNPYPRRAISRPTSPLPREREHRREWDNQEWIGEPRERASSMIGRNEGGRAAYISSRKMAHGQDDFYRSRHTCRTSGHRCGSRRHSSVWDINAPVNHVNNSVCSDDRPVISHDRYAYEYMGSKSVVKRRQYFRQGRGASSNFPRENADPLFPSKLNEMKKMVQNAKMETEELEESVSRMEKEPSPEFSQPLSPLVLSELSQNNEELSQKSSEEDQLSSAGGSSGGQEMEEDLKQQLKEAQKWASELENALFHEWQGRPVDLSETAFSHVYHQAMNEKRQAEEDLENTQQQILTLNAAVQEYERQMDASHMNKKSEEAEEAAKHEYECKIEQLEAEVQKLAQEKEDLTRLIGQISETVSLDSIPESERSQSSPPLSPRSFSSIETYGTPPQTPQAHTDNSLQRPSFKGPLDLLRSPFPSKTRETSDNQEPLHKEISDCDDNIQENCKITSCSTDFNASSSAECQTVLDNSQEGAACRSPKKQDEADNTDSPSNQ